MDEKLFQTQKVVVSFSLSIKTIEKINSLTNLLGFPSKSALIEYAIGKIIFLDDKEEDIRELDELIKEEKRAFEKKMKHLYIKRKKLIEFKKKAEEEERMNKERAYFFLEKGLREGRDSYELRTIAKHWASQLGLSPDQLLNEFYLSRGKPKEGENVRPKH